ncbi:hypothetical protein HDF26_004512 [Pedobacter cryoconitis]|uniref:PDDEXK-like family protein n=1 Tax=Pedobacter cryoconitis TaxID=188932 RepID=UPI0016185A15|nr:PD-(D/E)XK nuclease family protein [Pedobacter cryoconitis]MBB6274039.1 hypothetical protein [Pedobacter cryoconitis]
MDIINFLNSGIVTDIVMKQDLVNNKKKEASYNLFTISSYNSYIENFHSDIISSLLSPVAAHKLGNAFLFLFIDYLNSIPGLEINRNDFTNVEVTREKGKLDIWIKDLSSRRAIIIENKINNAMDMDNQLDRYWQYVETANYRVVAIIYLTLDGTKKAPPAEGAINQIIKNIEAFSSESNNLINGWLEPCLHAASNLDSSTFIYQYIKLIKHLANRTMQTNTMEELYQFISAENGFKTLDTIVKMYSDLTTFRADKFSKQLIDYSPFKKQFRYKPMYVLYDYYIYKDHRLKLDVWFEEIGGAEVVFWNVTTSGINGRMVLTERLNEIGLRQEFTDEVSYNDNGYTKHFIVGDKYKSMAEVDQAVLAFLKKIMEKLNAA